jgi:hypothetical protein
LMLLVRPIHASKRVRCIEYEFDLFLREIVCVEEILPLP